MLWKRSDGKGKARWERIGALMEKVDGKKSAKRDLSAGYLTIKISPPGHIVKRGAEALLLAYIKN